MQTSSRYTERMAHLEESTNLCTQDQPPGGKQWENTNTVEQDPSHPVLDMVQFHDEYTPFALTRVKLCVTAAWTK
jgi:hypothetical protein